MTFVKVCVFLVLMVHFLIKTKACHNALHTMPESDLDISGRRKRDVENKTGAKDADPELSDFFTKCMSKRSGQVFSSWRSVIDFILRDTYWFEATDVEYCGGRKDTVKCWQRRLEFLLHSQSSLVGPGKECIRDYGDSVNKKMGPEFELYYRTYYESFEYEPAYGEFRRWKRDTFGGDVFDIANQILSEVDEELEVVFTTPRTYFLSKTTTKYGPITTSKTTTTGAPLQSERECPAFSLVDLRECIVTGVERLVVSEIFKEFPSFEYFDEESNIKFVEDHHSSCRIVPQKKDGNVTYIENCDRPGSRPDILSSLDKIPDTEIVSQYYDIEFKPCLILDLPEIVKFSSPLFPIVSNCSDELLNSSISTTESSTQPNIPFTFPYKRPTKKGRIGKCAAGDHWTKFFNLNEPDGEGDMETISNIQATARGQLCDNPTGVEVRTARGHKYHSRTKELLYISVDDGLRCFNSEQTDGACQDYKIRFCCSTKDPECNGSNQWTAWLNRDRRTRDGDDESLQKHVSENNVCSDPVAIRARVKNSKKHYWKGYDVLDISPEAGLLCNNVGQKKRRCRDYEVSFCCPK